MNLKFNISTSEIKQEILIIEPWAEEYDLKKHKNIILDITLENYYDIEIDLSDSVVLIGLPAGSCFEATIVDD